VDPLGLGFDSSGTLYTVIAYFNSTAGAQDAGNELAIWNGTSIGNNAPSRTLTGAPFTTHVPGGGAIDGAGNFYLSNQSANQVSVFAASTVAAGGAGPAVLRTISTGSSPGAPTGVIVGP
jgi:hypothetical protein